MAIRIEVEWLEAPGIEDPILARSWGRLEIWCEAGEYSEPLTRVVDYAAKSTRNGVYGSPFPLARWIVENWWFLLCEPCRISEFHGGRRLHAVSKFERDWVRRHSFLVGREGNAVPDLCVYSDGPVVAGVWRPDPQRNPNVHVVRFLGEGETRVERENIEAALREFVDAVAGRVRDLADEESEVQEFLDDWAMIARTVDAERRVCEHAAMLSVDAYDPESVDVVEFLESSLAQLSPVLARDAFESTNSNLLRADVAWVKEGVDDYWQPDDAPQRSNDSWSVPAFEAGYSAARTFREQNSLGDAPLEDLDHTLSAQCGWPVEHDSIRPHVPDSGILALVGRSRSRLPRVTLTSDLNDFRRRFRIARAAYFVRDESATTPRLVTDAHSWEQRASRAFAAEFLAPATALRSRVPTARVDGQQLDDLGQEFGVHTEVIRHQLENHRLARVVPD